VFLEYEDQKEPTSAGGSKSARCPKGFATDVWIVQNSAVIPNLAWDKGFLRPLIGFSFDLVRAVSFNLAQG